VNAKEETEYLNRIPIARIGDLLGYKLPRRGLVRCPFPDHEDKNPSFYIHPSGTWWKCFGCGRRGGGIDLVKEALGLDFLAAKAWLSRHAGSNVPESDYARKGRSKQVQEKAQTEAVVPQADSEVLEYFLELVPLQQAGRDYLKSRAIGDKTASAFEVGQLETSSDALKRLAARFDFARLNSSGLLSSASSPENLRLVFPRPSLIFPFRENGALQYAQARYIGRESSAARWSNLRGHYQRIYNADMLSSDIERVAICEGVTDTLSAVELGYHAVGLVGVGARFSVPQIKALRKKTALILLDWDQRGEARAKQLQLELARFGVASVRIARPHPNTSDLNEYLVQTRAAS